MKHTIKLIIKYILYGISLGCTSFVIMCLFYFIGGNQDLLELIFKHFAKHSIGAMIIGIACGTTAIIYQFNRPCVFVKIIIHFCIGIGVFYPVAIYLDWIPFYPNKVIFTILQFLFSCSIFLTIWLCFYLFNRNEAKRINQRLKELEQNNINTRN